MSFGHESVSVFCFVSGFGYMDQHISPNLKTQTNQPSLAQFVFLLRVVDTFCCCVLLLFSCGGTLPGVKVYPHGVYPCPIAAIEIGMLLSWHWHVAAGVLVDRVGICHGSVCAE
jgi:hypothetical protein